MNLETNIQTLRSEINKSLAVLTRIEDYLAIIQTQKLKETSGLDEAMILTQTLANYYTCIETLFSADFQVFR